MKCSPTGSTASHNSSRKDGSEAGVHQKTRKQMMMEKLREQLYKGKAFIIKRYDETLPRGCVFFLFFFNSCSLVDTF